MTLPSYFWDRWPSVAGKLSWDVTITQVNSALHPSGWSTGGKVTAVGWQVTLCDPIWHVISLSSVVISIANCYIHVYFFRFDWRSRSSEGTRCTWERRLQQRDVCSTRWRRYHGAGDAKHQSTNHRLTIFQRLSEGELIFRCLAKNTSL